MGAYFSLLYQPSPWIRYHKSFLSLNLQINNFPIIVKRRVDRGWCWTDGLKMSVGQGIELSLLWIGAHNTQSYWLPVTTIMWPVHMIQMVWLLCGTLASRNTLQNTSSTANLQSWLSPLPSEGIFFIHKNRSFLVHIHSIALVVLVSMHSRFHPNLILGGTYSGQLVLWDNRVHKRTPVQRSPLSAGAHTVGVSFPQLENPRNWKPDDIGIFAASSIQPDSCRDSTCTCCG